jgi:hypothetical protein
MDRGARHGAAIDLTHWRGIPARALLFGEAQGRAVVTTTMPDTVLSIAAKHDVPARVIGRVGALEAPLEISTTSARLQVSLDRLDEAYHETIPRIMSPAVLLRPASGS